MRVNLPVSNSEYDFPGNELLMSTTDSKGVIAHCNAAFMRVSGFTMDELMGQPHSLVRHPDMPPEAFKDMWSTIGHGRCWTGIVKNRRKNGDHYWVRANVTPIMEGGRPQGYLSVRTKPAVQAEADRALRRPSLDQTMQYAGGEGVAAADAIDDAGQFFVRGHRAGAVAADQHRPE